MALPIRVLPVKSVSATMMTTQQATVRMET